MMTIHDLAANCVVNCIHSSQGACIACVEATLRARLGEAVAIIKRYQKQNYVGGQCVVDREAEAFLSSIGV